MKLLANIILIGAATFYLGWYVGMLEKRVLLLEGVTSHHYELIQELAARVVATGYNGSITVIKGR